jgi:hypothetical protein
MALTLEKKKEIHAYRMQQSWWPLKIFTEHKTHNSVPCTSPSAHIRTSQQVVRIYINNPSLSFGPYQRAESTNNNSVAQQARSLFAYYPLCACMRPRLEPGGQLVSRHLFPAGNGHALVDKLQQDTTAK